MILGPNTPLRSLLFRKLAMHGTRSLTLLLSFCISFGGAGSTGWSAPKAENPAYGEAKPIEPGTPTPSKPLWKKS